MSKLLFLLLLSTNAWADILFVDLNNSASEVTEARAEARRRGERLVVLPQSSTTESFEQQIRNALTAQTNAKKTFSTVILSGHYARQKFYGDSGEIPFGRLSAVFKDPQFSNIRKGVDSLLLWGCYTARPRAIADWKALLPGTQMLAGFNFAAPPSTALSSPRIMRNILRLSHDNIRDRRLIGRVQELVNLTQGKEDPYNFFGNTNLAVVIRGCYVSSKIGNIREEDLMECPPSLIDRLIKRRKRSYDIYANATLSSAELETKARSHGEEGLYRFKVDAQQYAKCFEASGDLPDPAEILALCAHYRCD